MFARAVIERELRVRTRRRITPWLRVVVGLAATVTAVSTLNWQSRFSGGQAAGKQMFNAVAWMAFAFSLIEGARCASDAISRERREGTLGLLLLTELSGFEVALGKFAAASLTSFYVLLALVPAMAIALPVGGVTAGEFWRTQAALLDTLFLAVAVAIWVSARSRDDVRALLGTLGMLSLLTLAPAVLQMHTWFPGCPNLSPGALMSLAEAQSYRLDPWSFWTSFCTIQLLAWALILTAGRTIAQAWSAEAIPDCPKTPVTPSADQREEKPFSFPPSLHARPKPTRRQLLESHPIQWLESRRDDLRGLVWLALLLPAALPLATQLLFQFFSSWPAVGGIVTGLYLALGLSCQLMLAFVACRRFAEERAAGTLELLLATPITPRQIALAHWSALWNLIRLPLVLSVLAPIGVYLWATLAQPWRPGRTGLNSVMVLYQLIQPLLHGANVLAVCWLGMWLGVRSTSAMRAVGFTLLWTMLVPYVGQSLLSLLMSFVYNPIAATNSSGWVILLVVSALGPFAYSLALLFWARSQLLDRLREGASAG